MRANTLVKIAIIVGGLYFAKDVLIPFALAILLSFLLNPLVRYFERLKTGRIAAVLLSVTLASLLLAAIGWVMAGQAVDLAKNLPAYRTDIAKKINAVRDSSSGVFGAASETISELTQQILGKPETSTGEPEGAAPSAPAGAPMPVQVVKPGPDALSIISSIAGPVLHWLGGAVAVLIFVVFMLIQREDLRDRIIRLIGRRRIHVTTQAIDDASSRISRYLVMQLAVNALYGFAAGLGLYLIGVPYGVLWGILAAVTRFLPYIGPWIGAAFPVLVAFSQPGWTLLLFAVGLFILLELLVAYTLEPLLYGHSTGLSPFAVLAAAAFWAWLWGALGLLLSTPLTTVLVVMGRHVPQLRAFSILLGQERRAPEPAASIRRAAAEFQRPAATPAPSENVPPVPTPKEK